MIMTDELGKTNLVEGWMKKGESALEKGNYQEAHEYFTQVLVEDPENWMAVFLRGKAAALQSTQTEPRVEEFVKATNEAIEIRSNVGTAQTEVIESNKMLAKSIYEFCKKNAQDLENVVLNKLRSDEVYNGINLLETGLGLLHDINDKETINLKNEIKKVIVWSCHSLCSLSTLTRSYGTVTSGMALESKQKYIDRHDELLLEIRMTEPYFKKSHGNNKWAIDRLEYAGDSSENLDTRQNRTENLQRQIDSQNQLNDVEYRRLYWETHPEEYQLFLEEQRRKEAQRERQRKDISQLISQLEEKIIKTNQEVENLRIEKDNLGPFAFKKKKEIDEKIDSLISASTKVQNEVNDLRQQLKSL